MLPQFHLGSRCRCGCSIKHKNKLTGPSPGVTFHFLLPTALQATRPKWTTTPLPKSKALPISPSNKGAANEEGKDLNPLLINQKRSLTNSLTNAGTQLAEGSAGLLPLLLNSAQGWADTQAPLFWRTTQMFKGLCWTRTQIVWKNQLQPVLIFMKRFEYSLKVSYKDLDLHFWLHEKQNKTENFITKI